MTSGGVVRGHLRTSAHNAHWRKELPFVLSLSEGLLPPREQLETLLPPEKWPRVSPRKQSQEMAAGVGGTGDISSPLRCLS